MPRKSLRPHLNQIRAWVRQGRTDAWVAHQLDVSVREIDQFKRQNELLDAEDSPAGPSSDGFPDEIDLRAEDDALIAAELEAAEIEAERAKAEAEAEAEAERLRREAEEPEEDGEEEEPDGATRTRRRTRRGGRGRKAPGAARARVRWRAPSTTARRATACGSTPPSRRTPSMRSTGRATALWKSPSRRTKS